MDDLRRENAKAAIDAAEAGQVVTIMPPGRSLDQNSLLHMWFSEVARQRDGVTLLDVKGEAHHKYGLPRKIASDPQFAWVWSKTGALLDYEKQCKYLASGVLNVSSTMSKPDLKSYMDDFSRDYRQMGFVLTDPELRRYG